jgi:hypothetical protein
MDLSILIVVASIVVPTLVALGFFWLYRRWQDRDGRRSPIEGKAIYGPGEQLRKRIEEHTDGMMGGLLALFFLGPYFLAAWALPRVSWHETRFGFGDWLLVAAFLAMTFWAIRRVIHHGNLRRRGLAGLKAELFTAQELNRLIASGCTVLHDVPGEGFNLDHVVIGPRAVYVVETKSVRKPKRTGKGDEFKVIYDGEALRFPDAVSRKPIAQALAQRDWLASYLKRAGNLSPQVVATVALPGWWIESSASAGNTVRVFNPAGRGAHFMTTHQGPPAIDTSTAMLITQALQLRYSSGAK